MDISLKEGASASSFLLRDGREQRKSVGTMGCVNLPAKQRLDPCHLLFLFSLNREKGLVQLKLVEKRRERVVNLSGVMRNGPIVLAQNGPETENRGVNLLSKRSGGCRT